MQITNRIRILHYNFTPVVPYYGRLLFLSDYSYLFTLYNDIDYVQPVSKIVKKKKKKKVKKHVKTILI